ncbi:PKD domain-containing protein [Candidatus Woesearchaeota archaeon]|nr:PKD domain-containing protein [Candidatus Woesearchaeota archaeon]
MGKDIPRKRFFHCAGMLFILASLFAALMPFSAGEALDKSPSLCAKRWTRCNYAFADDGKLASAHLTGSSKKNISDIWWNFNISLPENFSVKSVVLLAEFSASKEYGFADFQASGDGGKTFGSPHTVGGNVKGKKNAGKNFTINITQELDWNRTSLNNSNFRVKGSCFRKNARAGIYCYLDALKAQVIFENQRTNESYSSNVTNSTGDSNSTGLINNTNLTNNANSANFTNSTNNSTPTNIPNPANSTNVTNSTDDSNSTGLINITNPANSTNATNSTSLINNTNLTNSTNSTNFTNSTNNSTPIYITNPANGTNVTNSTNITNPANTTNETYGANVTNSTSDSDGTNLTGATNETNITIDSKNNTFDFSLATDPPGRNVSQERIGFTNIYANLLDGTGENITLSFSGCPPITLCNFSNNSGIVPFASGFSALPSGQTPQGSYLITLSGTSSGSLVRNTSFALNVSDSLPAAFGSAFPTVGASPLLVNFTSILVGGDDPVNYLWDFNDTTTSTYTSPSHIFSAAGLFNVSLTETDFDGDMSTKFFLISVS